MIENYSLFYFYSKHDDVLVVKFSNEDITYTLEQEVVNSNYHNIDLVSYEISGISKIMKIHAHGLIPLPNKLMIDVINTILKENGLETLGYKNHSGFYIGEVKEIEPNLIISYDNKECLFKPIPSLKKNDHVVIATPLTFLFNGVQLEDEHLCSYNDLGLSKSNDILIVDKDITSNDFFSTKENE